MAALSTKLRSAEGGRIIFWCPGCEEPHTIRIAPEYWTWNGDVEKPTFDPSIAVTGLKVVRDENGRWTGEWVLDQDGKTVPSCCHSYIRGGRIEFLSDCTHELAGQTVDLPEWNGVDPDE